MSVHIKRKMAATTAAADAEKCIKIDCPPGSIRPDEVLKMVLESTILTSDDFVISHRFFGVWTFVLKTGMEKIYEDEKAVITQALKKCYSAGAIRFASWT